MRFCAAVFALLAGSLLSAQTAAPELWKELATKREKLGGFHQTFGFQETISAKGKSQDYEWTVSVDVAGNRWRELKHTGAGDTIRLFDGTTEISMRSGENEFVRSKRKPKDPDPLPLPYGLGDPEWSKAVKTQRPCKFQGQDGVCVVLQANLRPTYSAGPGRVAAEFDTVTGALVYVEAVQPMHPSGSTPYDSEIIYRSQGFAVGKASDEALFQIPPGLNEVKELSKFSADKFKKQLAGQPAPAMNLRDMAGNPVDIAAFKGKVVLLDFWTTWCPPCQADGPSLDKLWAKYGQDKLAIVGVSVNEDRAIVEKYLHDHPHKFPIALTSENEMPRAYEIGAFPTYIVINPDGTIASAVEGDQGFGELRKLLKKAGMDAN